MRPRDLFGVAVRVIGLWEIIDGTYSAFWGVLKYHTGVGSADIKPTDHYAFGIYYAAVGLLLLLFADPIVWLVYGLPPKPTLPDDAANIPSTDG
jgi:hypothetical protein